MAAVVRAGKRLGGATGVRGRRKAAATADGRVDKSRGVFHCGRTRGVHNLIGPRKGGGGGVLSVKRRGLRCVEEKLRFSSRTRSSSSDSGVGSTAPTADAPFETERDGGGGGKEEEEEEEEGRTGEETTTKGSTVGDVAGDDSEIEELRQQLEAASQRVARTRGLKQELEAEAELLVNMASSSKETYAQATADEEAQIKAYEALAEDEKAMVAELAKLEEQRATFQSTSSSAGKVAITGGEEGEGEGVSAEELEEMLNNTSTRLEAVQKQLIESRKKIDECTERRLTCEAAALTAESSSGVCMGKAVEAVQVELAAVEECEALKDKLTKLMGLKEGDELPQLEKQLSTTATTPQSLEADAAERTSEQKKKKEVVALTTVQKTKEKFGNLIGEGGGKFEYGKALLVALLLVFGAIPATLGLRRTSSSSASHSLQSPPVTIVREVADKVGSVAQSIGTFTSKTIVSVSEEVSAPEPTEAGLSQTLWLLATSVVSVPLVCKLPGGSPVLGFLLGGALIGPYTLGLIPDVGHIQHIAELGVVFLLFNIGLELSVERLRSLQKFVFGLGSTQVMGSLAVLASGITLTGQLTAAAPTIVAAGLALSSTAVAIQVLQDRGELGSRHGRAAFSVLLFQDLAVVAILMLVPLLGGNGNGNGTMSAVENAQKIGKALSIAAVKAVIAVSAILSCGRLFLRPIYRRIAALENTEIFAATTLTVVLGTSVLTQQAGLSMALGAFLAGLLIAETEYHLQVEADIAPYKGLLLGLFFMTVGMEISPAVLAAQWKFVLLSVVGLIGLKLGVVALAGPAFGLSRMSAIRTGLLLAPGGEFAFVTFGEAVREGILSPENCSRLFIVVAISMALTPYLAGFGQFLAARFESKSTKSLQPTAGDSVDLRDHVIIAGFGRVGAIIGELLAERMIPYVALDVRSDRVAAGRDQDLPVFFGDAGSPAVLHSIGAEHATCAIVTLDTPGANYRAVWALNRHFPKVSTYVRAHDVDHGRSLEKAGANVVVPETLEPSLQLAAAALSRRLPPDEVRRAIDSYRKNHMSELGELSAISGGSLGYGYQKKEEEVVAQVEEEMTAEAASDGMSEGDIRPRLGSVVP